MPFRLQSLKPDFYVTLPFFSNYSSFTVTVVFPLFVASGTVISYGRLTNPVNVSNAPIRHRDK